MDLKKSVIGIGFTVKQRFQFLCSGFFYQGRECVLRLAHNLSVIFHFTQFNQFDVVA